MRYFKKKLYNSSLIKNNLYTKEGFSLIELMIVIAIIGILAALAIPRYQQAIEEAKIKEGQSVLNSIRGAEKIFKARIGNYVGVNINSGTKNDDWALLNIEVIDTDDWAYGASSWECGCNSGGGAGNNQNNVKIIPFARRERGVNINKVMHIRMDTGDVSELRSSLCAGVSCNQQR